MNKKVLLVLATMTIATTAMYVDLKAENLKMTESIKETALVETNIEVSYDIADKYHNGYVVADKLNVRTEPTLDSEVIGWLSFSEQIEYTEQNSSWAKIEYNEQDAYVYKEYLSESTPEYKLYFVPENTGFKSYMDYRCITSPSSNQYKLQRLNTAKTGENGIRMVGDRYCIAVGSAFNSQIGQYIDLILENGTIIPCIMGDMKADIHTDYTNIVTLHNGCVSEFIVETETLSSEVKRMGDASYCDIFWRSKVKEVKVYNKNIFDEQ